MIKQFNFYKSYSDNFANLSDVESGRFIKTLLGLMFWDKELDELSTDKMTSLLLLISDRLIEEKERELTGNHTPLTRERRFAFKSVYANIFFCLKDGEAGILIKQACDFMFGTKLTDGKDCAAVKTYFTALKTQLSKSKAKSNNSVKRKNVPMTLEKIRQDFPFLTGKLREDNPILNGVDLGELYKFIIDNKDELHGQSMYSAVEKFNKAT